jgi:hypothetical protein
MKLFVYHLRWTSSKLAQKKKYAPKCVYKFIYTLKLNMAGAEPIATEGPLALQHFYRDPVSNFMSDWLKVRLLTHRDHHGLHIGYFFNLLATVFFSNFSTSCI